jgi:peptidyl-prolyl cis-trans isomerase SurA
MLRRPVRLILACLFIASPCLPQTAKAHSGNNGSLAVQRDRVCLSEVLISAPLSDHLAQVTAANHKAERLRNVAQKGGSFADLAKANSHGPTAAQGGPIGCFTRGQLSKQLEERVFPLQVGEVSDVLRTKQGFVILQVTERGPR